MKLFKEVYVGMCADIIHPGHLNILKKANSLGIVIVGLLTDEAIIEYKKPPYMTFTDRKLVLESIKYVGKVVPQNTLDYSVNLRKYKPDIVVHGDDWRQGVQCEARDKVINTLNEWGGELVEVEYTKNISSTHIKNKIKN